ncbi:MAG TPA: hypothetical protein VFJ13_11605, partial [Paracoccaceae bacterium]|nr:hypothetical protein [Paracoccaceae bacterium]
VHHPLQRARLRQPASENTVSARLFIVGGSDVSLERAPAPDLPGAIVLEITLEHDDALSSSAAELGLPFVDFADFRPGFLELLSGEEMAAAPGESAFAPMAELASSLGLLAILPTDMSASEELVLPPAGAADSEWFAIPLWVVLRPNLLQLVSD